MRKISTYWKCQLIGWGVYKLAIYLFKLSNASHSDHINILRGILELFPTYILDLAVAHGLYKTIAHLKIFNRNFSMQAVYLGGLTLLFLIIKYIISISLLFLLYHEAFEKALMNMAGLYFLSFFMASSLLIWSLIYFGYNYVKRMVKDERQKAINEKKLSEMEARSLRAQMSPHFIFESIHFIRNYIKNKEKDKAINYLTTFSKLIRTLFQNCDKAFISLYSEIETCQLYAQLENMRYDGKLNYEFITDRNIDQHSVFVPALGIQPFIENAIHHQISTVEKTQLKVSVSQKDDTVVCIIDSEEIPQNPDLENISLPVNTLQVKGVNLTQLKRKSDRGIYDNTVIDLANKMDKNGKALGTSIQLTFNAYNDDQDINY